MITVYWSNDFTNEVKVRYDSTTDDIQTLTTFNGRKIAEGSTAVGLDATGLIQKEIREFLNNAWTLITLLNK